MNEIRQIKGGVCAAAGFTAGATGCGIKTGEVTRDDLAIVFSEFPAAAAATFTTNKVKAAPVRVSADHLRSGRVRAVVLNSGNANACTGQHGLDDARAMAADTAAHLGLKPEQVLVCSTGRIGVPLPVARIRKGLLGIRLARAGGTAAARAIMTSDTVAKEIAFDIRTEDGAFRIGGMAKGAGMIDPNMATMLCVITTDAVVPRAALRQALRESVEDSFNRITIDGDMSTNDTVILLANAAAGWLPRRASSDPPWTGSPALSPGGLSRTARGSPASWRSRSAARRRRPMRVAPPRRLPIPRSSNAPGPEAIRTGAASSMPSATAARK